MGVQKVRNYSAVWDKKEDKIPLWGGDSPSGLLERRMWSLSNVRHKSPWQSPMSLKSINFFKSFFLQLVFEVLKHECLYFWVIREASYIACDDLLCAYCLSNICLSTININKIHFQAYIYRPICLSPKDFPSCFYAHASGDQLFTTNGNFIHHKWQIHNITIVVGWITFKSL